MKTIDEILHDHGVPTTSRKIKFDHPKGFEPGVTFNLESGLPKEAVISSESMIASMEEHRAAVEAGTGVTVPDSLMVVPERLTIQRNGVTHEPERYWYKYVFRAKPADDALVTGIDAVKILNGLKAPRKPSKVYSGQSTFLDNINDLQLGKDAGGGTPATLERLDKFNDLLDDRIKTLTKYGYDLGELVTMGGGDIIEGCSIYPNQEWQIDLDMHGQEVAAVAYILDYLNRFAPKFKKVRVPVIGGNHGQNRINGKRVNRHDNSDTKVFRMAAMAAEQNPRLSHVEFYIAYEEAAITFDVQGHCYGLTHGDIYGKGKGGEPTLKAKAYRDNQAGGHKPIGDSVVLVGNHFHHEIVKNWGAWDFVQNPPQDGGSPEFSDYSGTDCEAGRATWLATPEKRITQYDVLR